VSRGQLNFLGLADSDGQVSLTGDSSRSELPWQAGSHVKETISVLCFFGVSSLFLGMRAKACQSSLVTDGKWGEAVWF
jgi:hypothetical protein